MTPDERFEKEWQHHMSTAHADDLLGWTLRSPMYTRDAKEVARSFYIRATQLCEQIALAWYNHGRFFVEGASIADVVQTINGTHPDPRVKVGELR